MGPGRPRFDDALDDERCGVRFANAGDIDTVLLAGRSEGDPTRLAILLAVIAFVAALCAAVFLLGTHIGRLLGVTGNIVLSRLLGVLLAALAVQYVVDGVRATLA